MKIVVTGAAGKLGRAAMAGLRAAGHEVTGFDLAPAPGISGVRRLDLRAAAPPVEAFADAEAVVHLANEPLTQRTVPGEWFTDNLRIHFNVFEAARLAGARRLIFASSIQAMTSERRLSDPLARGALPRLPLDGTFPACPTNVYSLAKALAEEMLRHQVRNTELSAVALRLPLLLPEPLAKPGKAKWYRLDEAFSWLTFADAARLIEAILRSSLPGFRVYLPAAPTPVVAGAVDDLRRAYFPGVPVTQSLPLGAFVDIRRITEETGWVPRDLSNEGGR